MITKIKNHFINKIADNIKAAQGKAPLSLVIKNTQILDVFSGEFKSGDIAILDDVIIGVYDSYDNAKEIIDGSSFYVVPGFIDSHLHIESSLMTPGRFQEAVLPVGTTTVIWDPHEIANVEGYYGIDWALKVTQDLILDVYIMVPSCVPSTSPKLGFETSGSELNAEAIEKFAGYNRVLGLAELMNVPGVFAKDKDVLKKIDFYKNYFIDGHSPGLAGKDLNAYLVAGIHTCHESMTENEAREKLSKGMHVLIREGSCAKNAEELLPCLNSYTSSSISFCTDDRNPVDIKTEGHINYIINKALKAGHKPQDVFRASSYSAANTYGLFDRGVIAPGYKADLCIVKSKEADWKKGIEINKVIKNGRALAEIKHKKTPIINIERNHNIQLKPIKEEDLKIKAKHPVKTTSKVRVIGLIPQQIITKNLEETLEIKNSEILSNPKNDVLKIAVFERHHNTGNKTIGFVKGFNIKGGAIATSVNHDSHNIITVGDSDRDIVKAVNRLIQIDGGIVIVKGDQITELCLPYAGLMTDEPLNVLREKLQILKKLTLDMGCTLEEPFITLSFLALPVIPSLKITDKGLVDVETFSLVDIIKE